ncbi:phosphoglycerate kinase [Candidatus Parcubacteria bacterium]|nr:MAG: phosphoglycerate kinase [Candidatus Parcubacteria bacterium]
MYIKSIRHYKKIKGKRVFLRASLNVPIKKGQVTDGFRIDKQLHTIRFLRMNGAKIIMSGHLGRPKGEYNEKYSLFPVAKYLEKKLSIKIKFIPNQLDFEASNAVAEMKEGDIIMIDNLRFNPGEKKNSKRFARQLADLADIYVNDAFANCHRAHASVSTIKNYLPAFAGLLLEEEIKNLHKVLKPKAPLVVILGGAKIKTKLPMVNQFKNKAYKILVAGALANSFLSSRGYEIGKSLIDGETQVFANKYKKNNLLIPVDVVVATSAKGTKGIIKKISEVRPSDYIFDIGPETVKLYSSIIREANTIIWNGPIGFYEIRAFRHGSLEIAKAVASRSKGKCFGVVGGGETVDALKLSKTEHNVDWVSTGGGAMLAYLGGKEMPGLERLVR